MNLAKSIQLAKCRTEPLSDTIQEQIDNAIDHGLDGIIVYVDKKGSEPELEGRIENADRITLRMLLQHRSGIPVIC